MWLNLSGPSGRGDAQGGAHTKPSSGDMLPSAERPVQPRGPRSALGPSRCTASHPPRDGPARHGATGERGHRPRHNIAVRRGRLLSVPATAQKTEHPAGDGDRTRTPSGPMPGNVGGSCDLRATVQRRLARGGAETSSPPQAAPGPVNRSSNILAICRFESVDAGSFAMSASAARPALRSPAFTSWMA